MFECRYKADESVVKEFVTKVIAHKIIGQAMFMVVVALIVTALSMRSSRSIFSYLYMGVALLSVAAVYYFPAKTMKKFKASDSAFFNGKADETVVTFNEDEIVVTEEPSSIRVPYDKVERILVYKVICVLLTSKSNGIVVKKDGFGEHTFEEFMEFINEKCVNKNKQAEEERAEAIAKKKAKMEKYHIKPKDAATAEGAKEEAEEAVETVETHEEETLEAPVAEEAHEEEAPAAPNEEEEEKPSEN